MSIWKSRAVIFYALIIGFVFTVLAFVELPGHSYLWREFSNFGHTPLFGLVALALLGLCSTLMPRNFPRFFQYFLAAAGASLLGLSYELIQIPTAGDSDPIDLIRNSAGIFGVLSVRLAFDRAYWQNRRRRSPKRRFGWLSFGLALLLAAALPLMVWAVAYFERDNSFPQLTNFDSLTGRLFVKTRNCRLDLIVPPAGWSSAPAEAVTRLTCYPGYDYPGIMIDDPNGDWQNFNYLYLEVYSEADTVTPLVISIEDHQHNREFEDRFSKRLELAPGLNRLELSLESIRVTPSGRLLDMASIARINLFVPAPEDSVVLLLSDLVLR